jgi:hypothetical protein
MTILPTARDSTGNYRRHAACPAALALAMLAIASGEASAQAPYPKPEPADTHHRSLRAGLGPRFHGARVGAER